ncbi:glycosyltransferase involved in cell wall biosynthesis [Sinobaca qinghaiensis]|uniref:Glycosyltransferase involved in cell wall biosynthesis n=1 Tax=Sinobaca qinghaiensis TaxID=342944 RepID=A0A419V8A4_9BACL|nr:glycosyltransferase [Sinobaca qinghaiensis]RKD76305.1 glycosyltransferase involved in cell wall biosynthesis [Sinobaca qinghaiensis]
MKKVAVLISHIPNPRILKRIKAVENDFDVALVYWDRGQLEKETFEINPEHNVIKKYIKAPQGKPIKRLIPLIKYMITVLNTLKYEKPDIIHAANLDMLCIAYLYKKFINVNSKIIYEVADLPKYTFIKKANSTKTIVAKLLQKLEKRLTAKISKIILTSPYFWDEYFSGFIEVDKYIFIPNAPAKKLFKKYEKKQNSYFTIGFIGSVRYFEQLKMLIDVVEEIDKPIKVFIAGNGPNYNEIKDYSKNKKFVEFYGPYNYEKEIVSLYEKIDCTYAVYNTKLDNVKIALPNRLYESIICEVPIIGTKNTALGNFIEQNKIGNNINEEKEELREVLLKLINSYELIGLYQKNCREIKSDYYYEKSSEKLLNEYLKITT